MAGSLSQAAHRMRRSSRCSVFYLEFERIRTWTVFNLKRPLADGGTARRILHRDDAFEGGSIDFDIAVDPKAHNWITLRLWESNEKLMTEHGNTIVLQTLEGDRKDRARWFLPTRMTEETNWEFEWYGLKPRPGRFVYASYSLPQDLTEGKSKIRLRLQGVGNVRRDHPMRGPTPPIYTVISHTAPFFEFEAIDTAR